MRYQLLSLLPPPLFFSLPGSISPAVYGKDKERKKTQLAASTKRKLNHQLSTHVKITPCINTPAQGFHKPNPQQKVATKTTPPTFFPANAMLGMRLLIQPNKALGCSPPHHHVPKTIPSILQRTIYYVVVLYHHQSPEGHHHHQKY